MQAALDEASTSNFGKDSRAFGEGGSIPFMGMLGEMFPEAQFVITGVLGPGANAHGPNEYLHIPTARQGHELPGDGARRPRKTVTGRALTTRNALIPFRAEGAESPMTVTTNLPQDDQATALIVERVFFELRKVIVGQSRLIERMLVGLLSQGHCLLESVPGLAKTLAAETLSKVVGGTFGRVQFTPDLLPSDIVGTRIFRSSSEKFDVELGPVFVNFLLADEINRAPAKVQSALLEVMAEQHVTIGGNTYDVPTPFFVIATQNPIESEGVYQLPEAQRDRFMMKITMAHPSADEEMTIVDRMSVSPPVPEQIIDLHGLGRAATAGDRCLHRPKRAAVRRRPRAGHPHARPGRAWPISPR